MPKSEDCFRWSDRLYVRIYVAMLASLFIAAALFAMLWHMNPDPAHVGQNLDTFAEIAAETLPPADAPLDAQQDALEHWHPRMHADLALYGADGTLIASVGRPLPPLDREQTASGWLGGHPPVFALKLPDGRWLVGERHHPSPRPPQGLIIVLLMIALAVGVGAYPVVRRLTSRLERLQSSVDALGAGQLSTRVAVEGSDEVARLAESFNRSASRIEALIAAQKSLLANASHELRSPLARIRMAVELLDAPRTEMREELTRNITELDQLIDEILLASRLDASPDPAPDNEAVDFAALVAEECARIGAESVLEPAIVQGDIRLLRRMVRNLLENAKRYGEGSAILANVTWPEKNIVQLDICDGGKGVPPEERENIFAPFYRVPGARERDGGVGLGLSLVRQIARKHGGDVACLAREGEKGSCFRVKIPALIATASAGTG